MSQQLRQLLQRSLINLIKTLNLRTIDINNRHNFSLHQDRHHNLALRISITCDVARERLHVWNELGLHFLCRSAAHALSEPDGLTGYFTVEGAQNQLVGGGRIEDVESC